MNSTTRKSFHELIRHRAVLQLLSERQRGLEGASRAQLPRGAEIESASKEQKSLDDRDEKIWKVIQRGLEVNIAANWTTQMSFRFEVEFGERAPENMRQPMN